MDCFAVQHRRGWDFSLRSLFVAVTLISIPLGWITWQRHIVQQRVRIIEIVNAIPNIPYYSFHGIRERFGGIDIGRNWFHDVWIYDLGIPWPEDDAAL